MKKLMLMLAVGAVAIAAYAQPSMARDFADIYTECGVGAIIAPRNAAVAAVTNVTWDSGTTAISSNITTPDTCKGGQEKTAAFIHDSYKPLESDLASGNGQYIDALAVLAQAKNPQAFKQAVRQDFAKVVASPNYSTQSQFEKSKALYDIVYKNVNS